MSNPNSIDKRLQHSEARKLAAEDSIEREIGRDVASKLKWNGRAIMEAFREALTQVNFHAEAKAVTEWLSSFEY